MKIIIDIPVAWIKDMRHEEFTKVDALCQKILDGTPLLPKECGNLVDAEEE